MSATTRKTVTIDDIGANAPLTILQVILKWLNYLLYYAHKVKVHCDWALLFILLYTV